MRLVRNLAILLMLLAAPFAANFASAAEVGVTSTCGDCDCPNLCCDKSWLGGCECKPCSPDV